MEQKQKNMGTRERKGSWRPGLKGAASDLKNKTQTDKQSKRNRKYKRRNY